MKKISKNLLKLSILSLILVFSFGLNLDKESKLLASSNFNVSEIDLEIYDNFYMDGLILFDSNMNGNWDIYAMDGQGRNLRQLTFSTSDERWPSLSPDGSHYAYSSNQDGNYNIVIQELDGDYRFNLTHNGSNEIQPDWGPYEQILYVSDVNGNKDIFLKNIWGTPEEMGNGQSQGVQMTFDSNDDTEPAFGGEYYDGIFAFVRTFSNGNDNIMAYDINEFREWPVKNNTQNQTHSPEFHPYESFVYNNLNPDQPQFLYIDDSQSGISNLFWSNIGYYDDYGSDKINVRLPGKIEHVSMTPDDECTIAFSTQDGKIGLLSHCQQNNNPILLPDGNSNFRASKIDYGRNINNGGFMGGMMGGMMDMGNSMMGSMQRQDEMMREEMERQAELDRERNEMMRQQMEEQERMDRERMEQQMQLDEERARMDRERIEQQMEQDRERMELERQMMEEQDEFDRQRMEQQREMMGRMEGSGGRDDYFEPDEKCFIQDEEEGRGLFGNMQIGAVVDCEGGDGLRERFEDPTSLAMLGLVVTVGATLLQMLRGN